MNLPLTMQGKETILKNNEFTIEDPATFTDKITVQLPMAKVDGLLYEYACHEGNYGLLNTLRGARQEERDAAGL